MAVTLTVWNSGPHAVVVTGTKLGLAPGWYGSEVERLSPETGSGLEQWRARVEVTKAAVPTVPYFLKQSLRGDLYAWQTADAADRGTPLGAAAVVAVFDLQIAGEPLRLEREVVFQYRDQALGEVRRPLRALPQVEVAMQPEMILWPVDRSRTTRVEVLVSVHRRGLVEGVVELESNQRWPASRQQRFAIDGPGAKVVRFQLEPPPSGFLDRAELTANVTSTDGGTWASSWPVIDYPHIRPVTMPRPARLELQTLDLRLPDVGRVGYVRGASDRVPEVLVEVGLPVEVLSVEALQAADLAAYDALVIGSRAYETEPLLAGLNPHLLEYVRRGGHLLVQYQQYQFAEAGLAPTTLRIGRPHGRVTDESAPVRILRPGHPVFEAPNRITESDWQGWVQERGLYFAAEWGPEFVSLLEMHDEGRPDEGGSLLMAKIGDGTYIYTGLSFFRQLPAGVPGAIRLFVNLLAGGSS